MARVILDGADLRGVNFENSVLRNASMLDVMMDSNITFNQDIVMEVRVAPLLLLIHL